MVKRGIEAFVLVFTFVFLLAFSAVYLKNGINQGIKTVGSTLTAQAVKPEDSLDSLTSSLLQELGRYSKRPSRQSLNRLIELSSRRKQLILSLIKEDSLSDILRNDLSSQRNNFPAEVQNNIERRISISGSVNTLIVDDFENQISWTEYSLQTTGNMYNLNFIEDPYIPSGTQINVNGILIDDEIIVNSYDIIQQYQITTPPVTRKAAVILIKFQNYLTETLSQPQALSTMNSVKSYYEEASFNQLSFLGHLNPAASADIFGYVTIPYDNVNCDYATWGQAARNAAQSLGFNQANYDNVVHMFTFSDCNWAGLAYLPGTYSFVARGQSFTTHVVGHELGHNIGAHHASSYICISNFGLPVSISNSCTINEYGDPFDIMGNLLTVHMNNFHKGQVGWFTSANTVDVSNSGTFTIEPIEYPTSGIKSLRIPRDVVSNQVQRYYYVEYRRPFGIFENFPLTDPVVNGVSIRLAPPYNTLTQSWLIDATPDVLSNFYDSSLLSGRTFVDPIKNITITTLSVSPTNAVVNVVIGGSVNCGNANPGIFINPLTQDGAPGQTLDYNITVTNNDNPACGTSQFNIFPSLPTGWTQTPPSFFAFILPGGSITQSAGITSSLASAVGSYAFAEIIQNSALPNYNANATAYFNIAFRLIPGADTTPPSITITNPQNGAVLPSSGIVQVSSTATDPSGINFMRIYIDNILEQTCTGGTNPPTTLQCTYNWHMNQVSSGTHTIKVTAKDNSPYQNTGSVSITVIKP